jgi:hypothetical protein
MRASGTNAVLYDRLKRRLGIRTPTKVHGAMDILAEVEPEILDRLYVDLVPLEASLSAWNELPAEAGVRYRLYGDAELWFAPGTDIVPRSQGGWLMRDRGGNAFAEMPEDGFYFDFIKHPMGGGGIDPRKHNPVGKVDDETLEAFGRRARRLHTQTDKAIPGACRRTRRVRGK